jgi:hypothetical protein
MSLLFHVKQKTQEMIIHFLRFFHAEIPAASRPLHGRTWDIVFRGEQEMAAERVSCLRRNPVNGCRS